MSQFNRLVVACITFITKGHNIKGHATDSKSVVG